MLRALESAGCISRMLNEDCPFISPAIFLIKKAVDKPNEGASGVALDPQYIDPANCALRLVVDYRFLNSQIRVSRHSNNNNSWSRFPIPDARLFIHSLKDMKYVTATDFTQSFWHGKLGENEKRLLSFSWDNIQYKMERLPQGVRFASSILQRFLTKLILRHNLQDNVFVFIDNCYIGEKQDRSTNKAWRNSLKFSQKPNLS